MKTEKVREREERKIPTHHFTISVDKEETHAKEMKTEKKRKRAHLRR